MAARTAPRRWTDLNSRAGVGRGRRGGGPAVGRAVADQLAGRPTPELDGLSPSRIAGFKPVEIERFLAHQTGPVLAVR